MRGEGRATSASAAAVVSLVPRHISHQGVPPAGSYMRYFVAACFLGLGLGVALGLLLVTLGDAWESFDPNEAPAVLRLPARGVRAIRSHVIELVDTFSTAHRDANPTPPSQLGGNQASHTICAAC